MNITGRLTLLYFFEDGRPTNKSSRPRSCLKSGPKKSGPDGPKSDPGSVCGARLRDAVAARSRDADRDRVPSIVDCFATIGYPSTC